MDIEQITVMMMMSGGYLRVATGITVLSNEEDGKTAAFEGNRDGPCSPGKIIQLGLHCPWFRGEGGGGYGGGCEEMRNDDRRLSFEKFYEFVEGKEEELWKLFREMDQDSDGFVKRVDLMRALYDAGVCIDEKGLDAFFGRADKDGNGGLVQNTRASTFPAEVSTRSSRLS
ncbi:hypothetical protein M427DRAFT_29402 [Gonapodya prolifera JEL478]|uniref:EF-hand domain-containing protein n=1 Tax=Gonapodya prolifera (strain JEL478) TaxID=1344416 RepID=A0A139AQD4_GONPJ|nr:hypothetical protein M427DRAFT_29402 [Gonapodya prolifera JEL478]|eukprot:KXS18960.1 hypothetical protein M427DRAFT_29402 [Gonapodya prolifera JEL478]